MLSFIVVLVHTRVVTTNTARRLHPLRLDLTLPDLDLRFGRDDVGCENKTGRMVLPFYESHVVLKYKVSEHAFQLIRREEAARAGMLPVSEVEKRGSCCDHLMLQRLRIILADVRPAPGVELSCMLSVVHRVGLQHLRSTVDCVSRGNVQAVREGERLPRPALEGNYKGQASTDCEHELEITLMVTYAC